VPQDRATLTRERLIKAATELVRRKGYVATTVDDICELSGVTKGAFFHHFKSKEELVQAALGAWDGGAVAMEANAPFQSLTDPRERALGYMDFYLSVFNNPEMLRSCLAGTVVQEVADTNPSLRGGANACFLNAGSRFQALLDEAFRDVPKPVDTTSLAQFWMAALQGSLVLSKASQDASVIRRNLLHARQYIAGLLS
jgi:TetR/AcrR family transcriptional regulator, transcriptional repressor for nem operon